MEGFYFWGFCDKWMWRKGGGLFTEEDSQLVTTLAGQVAVAIENARNFDKLRQSSLELKEAHFQTIGILSEAIEAKDAVTGGHSGRMLCFAAAVAKRLQQLYPGDTDR